MNNIETLSPEATKKEVRQLVYNRLSDALGEFKPLIKRKKLDDKMLTATKLFADDIIKSNRKTRTKDKKKNNKEAETMNGHPADID
jgi:hypothetical protein